MAELVLVTGGTGTTGSLVAGLLREEKVAVRIGSRRPSGTDGVHFDWNESATFAPALADVSAVYLVAPTDRTDHLAAMRPFLDDAVRRDVRLVLLSAASLPEGGPMMGEVQAWLHEHATHWVSLRPSWFMQNFINQHLPGILADECIYSATEDGRVAFIDALDIARVAVAALTDPDFPNGDIVLTGPEPLSYDDVAAAITQVAAKPVRHCRLSVEDLAARHAANGLPPDYAALLAGMDLPIVDGAENRTTEGVAQATGQPPGSLAAFLSRECKVFAG